LAIRYRLELLVVRFIALLVRPLPLEAVLGLGELLGEVVYSLGYRRKVARDQIRATIGKNWPAERVEKLLHRVYANIGKTFVEILKFPCLDELEILNRVTADDLSGLDRLLERGRGIILISAHFGNWELLGGYMALRGYPVNFVVADLRNPLTDGFLTARRSRWGGSIIRAGRAMRDVLKFLRRNQCVAILPDQDAGKDGEFLDFLGRTASVNTGVAAISLRTGAPIFPGFLVRRGKGRYHLHVPPPLYPEDYPGPFELARRALARDYSDLIASYIRRYPDHWLWTHRRWKTRPPGERAGNRVLE